jgi:hypothetical protein
MSKDCIFSPCDIYGTIKKPPSRKTQFIALWYNLNHIYHTNYSLFNYGQMPKTWPILDLTLFLSKFLNSIMLVAKMWLWKTFGYRTETMYCYYIVMEIYVFVTQISIHIFIFNVQLLWQNHPLTMDFTHLQTMPKPFKTKLSFPFTNIFYETSHL